MKMPPDVVDRQLVDDFYTLVVWMDNQQAREAEQAGGE
jgi:hypothetical protein